uniref:Uncharacterized protein n=1 Tax=Chromera velia CCMP2878 TaxID=1169474 RepID=A0A0G4H8C8_9ALVE|eukprot:Cvel_25116.t1-p1 / transcript=Cvel_25116.t1 / gene=Cvel_25116 / organism=Chromera_velia_CCMP2878 / gene_product=hypothetical protein / transcript_product=hypothetical protein / location=Cvel_scaffold2803:12068-15859(-) / protein_length=100 / sequence_SO=supercontig / SO=protein_coding / is_pseudo=false
MGTGCGCPLFLSLRDFVLGRVDCVDTLRSLLEKRRALYSWEASMGIYRGAALVALKKTSVFTTLELFTRAPKSASPHSRRPRDDEGFYPEDHRRGGEHHD